MANGVVSETRDSPQLSSDELRQKIIQQVEFYFGDYNLPKDKFLLSKTKVNDGWIELDTLLTFNRLKSLSTDKTVISEALKASDHGIIEVSEDNLKVRRNPEKPLPASFKEEFLNKTVYVKGFPKEASLDQLIEFFKPYGSGCVKMRRFSLNRQFKGSVFVLMESLEAAKKLRETTGLKFQDQELIIMMAQEHADLKAKERNAKSNKNKEGDKGNEANELKEMAKVEEMFQKMDKKPGVFLRVSGIPKDATISFQDFKTAFADVDCKASFVEFEKGDETATVRFEAENGAKVAAEKLVKDGKLKIKDVEMDATVLEGDEETAQYRKQAEIKSARFEQDRQARKRGGQYRQQGYRGKGGKRSSSVLDRSGGNNDNKATNNDNKAGGTSSGGGDAGGDEPQAKQAKTD